MKEVKQFQFQKGEHVFSYFYDDTKAFMDDLVDLADSEESVLDLADILPIIREMSICNKFRMAINLINENNWK